MPVRTRKPSPPPGREPSPPPALAPPDGPKAAGNRLHRPVWARLDGVCGASSLRSSSSSLGSTRCWPRPPAPSTRQSGWRRWPTIRRSRTRSGGWRTRRPRGSGRCCPGWSTSSSRTRRRPLPRRLAAIWRGCGRCMGGRREPPAAAAPAGRRPGVAAGRVAAVLGAGGGGVGGGVRSAGAGVGAAPVGVVHRARHLDARGAPGGRGPEDPRPLRRRPVPRRGGPVTGDAAALLRLLDFVQDALDRQPPPEEGS